jgi:hypothetical protein
VPTEDTVAKYVDALIGLAAFPPEQVLAQALSKKGADLSGFGSASGRRSSRRRGSVSDVVARRSIILADAKRSSDSCRRC